MFKNMYGKITEAINKAVSAGEYAARPYEPVRKTKPVPPAPPPATEGSEKTIYEQEHFEGHEAECDFCLSESLENLNGEKLKEYIIFSEILGKPKSKQNMQRR